uniref:Uncharacterized protein n=1 Tax=Arundo donax TaxID=35708 RepID=A0A0A9H9I1_ARUDO
MGVAIRVVDRYQLFRMGVAVRAVDRYQLYFLEWV